MTTIGKFERALGRRALWAAQPPAGKTRAAHYVQRLRIYPHALRDANAYYSPEKKALLFGYFPAPSDERGDHLPAAWSSPACRTTWWRTRRPTPCSTASTASYQQPTNPDVLAFHEAFADIVALFQHFTHPERAQAPDRPHARRLRTENLLAELAQQFGRRPTGLRAPAQRIGEPRDAKRTDYRANQDVASRMGRAPSCSARLRRLPTHLRARIATSAPRPPAARACCRGRDPPVDLVRPPGQRGGAQAADHVLKTCIRAFDYCPPVDLTFGEYLRALITADMDLEPEDRFNYRTAFISGFRARGIFPQFVRSLSEATLRWGPPEFKMDPDFLRGMLKGLDTSWNLSCDRAEVYLRSERNARALWTELQKLPDSDLRAAEKDLGVFIAAGEHVPVGIRLGQDKRPVIQINSVRPARRINSRGQQLTDLVVEAIQRYRPPGSNVDYRGGFTLLIDLENSRIRHVIRKRVDNDKRIEAEKEFHAKAFGAQSYFEDDKREPFAMLHRGL